MYVLELVLALAQVVQFHISTACASIRAEAIGLESKGQPWNSVLLEAKGEGESKHETRSPIPHP